MTSTTATTGTDEGYATLERLIAARVADHSGHLFTTDADPKSLWGTFLHSLPEESRQHYNCHACRHFVERFGGLVKVDPKNGHATALLWSPHGVPAFFGKAVWSLYHILSVAKITGVFLSSAETWGTPVTPDPKKDRTWTHMHGVPAEVFGSRLITAEQAMAEKREEHGMLARALDEFGPELAAEALRILRSGTLARSEKALAVAEWFADVHERIGARPRSPSQLWLAVANAPVGFAHVRNTVLATLLDDVKAGLSFGAISRKWNEKLDPLAYQRPQAAPSAGAIDAAEKLVVKLGVERSLERRFARLADVPWAAREWEPKVPEPAAEGAGTFAHLRVPKKPDVKRVALPLQKVSWSKFRREVLPHATTLEVELPYRGSYFALTAPLHADAPNVFQWDDPVAWYFHDKGALRTRMNLGDRKWGEVVAVTRSPVHWRDPSAERFTHHKKMALFVLADARDLDWRGSGLGLFPEFFRSEFHGIRSVVEAHSRAKSLTGFEESDANGLAYQADGPEVTVRVDGLDTYRLDRWS